MVIYTDLRYVTGIRSIVLICIVFLHNIRVTDTQLVQTASARRLSNFDNKLMSSTRRLWTKQERHATFCVAECARDISCISAFYTKDGSQCQGHSITFWDEQKAVDQANTKLYVLPRGERYIGAQCTDVSDCITSNSQCFNGTCICIHGYSLKPTTYECLPDCSVYGHDFMEVKNFYISGTNLITQLTTTFEDCKTLCRGRTDFVCRSIEYMWSAEKCFLANVTYSHHPDRWYPDPEGQFNISYFQRDCEQ